MYIIVKSYRIYINNKAFMWQNSFIHLSASGTREAKKKHIHQSLPDISNIFSSHQTQCCIVFLEIFFLLIKLKYIRRDIKKNLV